MRIALWTCLLKSWWCAFFHRKSLCISFSALFWNFFFLSHWLPPLPFFFDFLSDVSFDWSFSFFLKKHRCIVLVYWQYLLSIYIGLYWFVVYVSVSVSANLSLCLSLSVSLSLSLSLSLFLSLSLSLSVFWVVEKKGLIFEGLFKWGKKPRRSTSLINNSSWFMSAM